MKKLKIASISDIHLGHKRNLPEEIIANLEKAFPDNAETADLDVIFIVGDVFDQLLSLPDPEVLVIDQWIYSLLRLCKKHDIVLRVLEGTPLHDWKQSARFNAINKLSGINADALHVPTLSIEYIESLGIHVLYVPDEWEDSAAKTLDQVRELMRAKGLRQVDYALMHGHFGFQVKSFMNIPHHDDDTYQDLVKELIFVGHDHRYMQSGRIIAQGSFDRLVHGEEYPKGHVRATVYENGERDIVFVENKGAKKFVTVNCTYMTLEETTAAIDKVAVDLPDGSYVRIEADQDNPIFTNMEVMIRRYPCLVWGKLVREKDAKPEEAVEDETIFVPITLTKENLPRLLMDRLVKSGVAGDVLEAAEFLLSDVLAT